MRNMANVLTFHLIVEQSLIATSMAELMRERTRLLEEKDQSVPFLDPKGATTV